jgi:AraC-like DNA-binding protein
MESSGFDAGAERGDGAKECAAYSKGMFLHYLPISEEDRRSGMVCTTAGEYETAPHTVYPPRENEHPAIYRTVAEGRVLPEFQIVSITKGQGVFHAEGKTYAVHSGDVMLILPGMNHAYKPDMQTGWHEYWVGFNGSHFEELLDKGVLSKDAVFFSGGGSDTLPVVFDMIITEIRDQKPLFQLKVCAGILSILAEVLASARRREQPNCYQRFVQRAKLLMEQRAFGAADVSSIARETGISVSRLNEVFKKYTGMTPYQYFIHIKINKAKSLLEDEDMTVQYAAWKLGFDDPCYFSRLFKHKTGIAPSQWRRYIKEYTG